MNPDLLVEKKCFNNIRESIKIFKILFNSLKNHIIGELRLRLD